MKWPNIPSEVITVGKIVITGICFWYLYNVVPINSLSSMFSDLGFRTSILLIGIVCSKEVATSISLKTLISNYSPISLWTAIKIDSMGATANTFIPSRAGSLVSTPIIISSYSSINKNTAFKVKGVQFVFIAGYTGVLAAIGILSTYQFFDHITLGILIASTCVYIGFVGVVVVSRYFFPQIRMYLPEQAKKLSTTEGALSSQAMTMAGIAIGGGFVAGFVRFFIISRAFGSDLPLFYCVFLPVLLYVVTVLPVSFGGIGVAESSGITILTAIGVPATLASTIVLTDRLIGTYLPLISSFTIANISVITD